MIQLYSVTFTISFVIMCLLYYQAVKFRNYVCLAVTMAVYCNLHSLHNYKLIRQLLLVHHTYLVTMVTAPRQTDRQLTNHTQLEIIIGNNH